MMIFAAKFALLFGLLASVVASYADATPGLRSSASSTNDEKSDKIHLNADDRHLTSVVQGQVTKIQLIDANTDTVITELEDGMVISLDAIKSGMNGTTVALNVEALVNGTDVRSVRFGLNGNKYFKTESNAPFAMCGNGGSNYYSCGSSRLGVGNHTITATPRNRNGQTGRPVTMSITIVETDVTPPVLLDLKALSPTTVDVTNGDAFIKFQLTVKDEASGDVGGDLMYRDFPNGTLFNNFHFQFGSEFSFEPVPSIGIRNNEPVTFNITFVVRKFFERGVHPVYMFVHDGMENFKLYDTPDLKKLGFVHEITVINNGPVDNTKPVLVSFKALSPLTITQNSTARFEVSMQDDLSGIDFGQLYVWNSSSFQSYAYTEFGKAGVIAKALSTTYYNNDVPPLPAGVPHTFAFDLFFFAQPPRGELDLYLTFGDGSKNFTVYEGPDLAALGLPSSITVV